jgi:hypothetical protein
MLATTVDALNIPALWYPIVQQIQTATEPPIPLYLDRINRGFHYVLGASSTVSAHVVNLPKIEQLGWSAVEALETHLRFRSFADDWDAPGMEAYDDL